MSTLTVTRDQALANMRKFVSVGGVGLVPARNPTWPLSYGNYCMATVASALGIRAKAQLNDYYISIKAFRAHYRWPEYALRDAQPGDLVLLRWEASGLPDHIGMIESVNAGHTAVVSLEGNTGPRVGVSQPNGFYKRDRFAVNIVGVVRPPYAQPAKAAPKPAAKPKPAAPTKPVAAAVRQSAAKVYVAARPGDGLIAIAARNHITFDAIKRLNTNVRAPRYAIAVGQRIRVH